MLVMTEPQMVYNEQERLNLPYICYCPSYYPRPSVLILRITQPLTSLLLIREKNCAFAQSYNLVPFHLSLLPVLE